jgi:uncharacterized membrane protein
MNDMFDVFCILLLFCGILILAVVLFVTVLGARGWAEAIAALHKARAHGVQADAEQTILNQASDAVEKVREVHSDGTSRHRPAYDAPSEDDLRAALLAQRLANAAEEDREYTTHGNEGFADHAPIPGGGFYRDVETGQRNNNVR